MNTVDQGIFTPAIPTLRSKSRLSSRIPRILIPILVLYLLYRWNTTTSYLEIKPINAYPHVSRALVIAAITSSNLTWLAPALQTSKWIPNIYITDSPDAALTVSVNKGNEAMVYLTYIIDNYESLPDVIFFHHDHQRGWHQTFPSAFELATLNLDYVLESGYVSPRCLLGCENVIALSERTLPVDQLTDSFSRDVQIASFLKAFTGEVPSKIASPCCAQFAVSKEAIYERNLEGWEAIRKWLQETKLASRSSGRILEYTWHLLFGMEAVYCPEEATCLCKVFGLGC